MADATPPAAATEFDTWIEFPTLDLADDGELLPLLEDDEKTPAGRGTTVPDFLIETMNLDLDQESELVFDRADTRADPVPNPALRPRRAGH